MMTKLSDLSTNHPLYAFVVFDLRIIMGIGRTSLGNLVRLGSRVRSRHWSLYNTPGENEDSWSGLTVMAKGITVNWPSEEE